VRGCKRFDGFLVEYFANPMRQIKKYIDSSYNDAQILEINMILNGIVILDNNSAANIMRQYCLQKDLNNFPTLGEFHTKTSLYHIWDGFDELTRAHDNKDVDFVMQYYNLIQKIFYFYSRYICSPVPNHYHLYKWLTNKVYHEKFNLPPYRDTAFLDLVSKSFSVSDMDAMFTQTIKLKDYVFDKTNGIDIDNFLLKSPCD